jgi:hypothetical protein
MYLVEDRPKKYHIQFSSNLASASWQDQNVGFQTSKLTNILKLHLDE